MFNRAETLIKWWPRILFPSARTFREIKYFVFRVLNFYAYYLDYPDIFVHIRCRCVEVIIYVDVSRRKIVN